jgi:hypothetical protein
MLRRSTRPFLSASDATFKEDNSRVSKRGAAQVMATFKNLAIGIFELEKERGRTKSQPTDSLELQTYTTPYM